MEEKLKLNDGTVLDGSAVTAGNELFLYLYGYTLEQTFYQLHEKRKTKKIICIQNNGTEITCTGYTALAALRNEGGGTVTAVLRKEEI